MVSGSQKHRFKVPATDRIRQRLDVFLAAKLPGCSRRLLADQIKLGRVRVGGVLTIKPKTLLQPGQAVEVKLDQPSLALVAQPIPLNIIYYDEDIAVIDKPAGLVMHPAPPHRSGTLANALKARFKNFYLVHRLDKDTSGVVMVALQENIKKFLAKLFEQRKITKTYLALLKGKITPHQAYLDLPIGRGRKAKFEVLPHGRQAQSFYRVKEYLPGFSLVEIKPKSGRTHQIRVHFRALGHPVVGDLLYGQPEPGLKRQFLHASQLEFTDWRGRKRLFGAPLPIDLRQFLNYAKK